MKYQIPFSEIKKIILINIIIIKEKYLNMYSAEIFAQIVKR